MVERKTTLIPDVRILRIDAVPALDKMMTTQGDNFVLNELIREYLEWNGCGNAADILVCTARGILGGF